MRLHTCIKIKSVIFIKNNNIWVFFKQCRTFFFKKYSFMKQWLIPITDFFLYTVMCYPVRFQSINKCRVTDPNLVHAQADFTYTRLYFLRGLRSPHNTSESDKWHWSQCFLYQCSTGERYSTCFCKVIAHNKSVLHVIDDWESWEYMIKTTLAPIPCGRTSSIYVRLFFEIEKFHLPYLVKQLQFGRQCPKHFLKTLLDSNPQSAVDIYLLIFHHV